jgi:hypothetical protein
MNIEFDTFVKEHLQEILCEAEKEHALAQLKKPRLNYHKRIQLTLSRKLISVDIRLQDCAISPSFSHSQL